MTFFENKHGAFLSRHLQTLLPGLIEQKVRARPFTDGMWIPTIPELTAGTDTVTQEVLTRAGSATVMGDLTTTIPLSSAAVSEVSRPTVAIASAFGYAAMDLERMATAAANGSQINLMGARQQSAVQAIDEKVELLTIYGDESLGFQGTVNNPDVPIWDKSSFDPFDVNTTDRQIITFFKDVVVDIMSTTNMTIAPDTILVSLDLFSRISEVETQAQNETLLNLILKVVGPMGITSIMPTLRLGYRDLEKYGVKEAATNEDRMMVYRRDQSVLNRAILRDILQFGQVEGPTEMFYKVPIFTVISPTHFNFPESAYYIDHAADVV